MKKFETEVRKVQNTTDLGSLQRGDYFRFATADTNVYVVCRYQGYPDEITYSKVEAGLSSAMQAPYGYRVVQLKLEKMIFSEVCK